MSLFSGPLKENKLNTTTNVANVSFLIVMLFVPVKKMRTVLLFNFLLPSVYSLIKAIGVSNQRETTVVWDKLTGEPLYNAVGKLSCMDAQCKAFLHLQVWSY